MSVSNLLMQYNINTFLRQAAAPTYAAVRQGHVMRGKPPGVAKSLEQRLNEENKPDEELTARVNIGFPRLMPSRSQQLKERLKVLKAQRSNSDLEKLARQNKLIIDLNEVEEEYRKTNAPYDIRVIADHYGVYEDLFGLAFFIPRVPLSIKYDLGDDILFPVYNGNIIKPADAAKAPEVDFDGVSDPITGKKVDGDSFWTLIATNPDAHFKSSDSEYVHWFVANIPNGDLKKGDVLIDYLQPFPPKGIGYQRFIYVLYKQNSKLDFSSYKLASSDYNNLEKRTFKTLDFYRKYQDDITPAGLAFFQTDWDETLHDFYHNVLDMKEPFYEYDFPKPYLADQKWFPLKQAFNLYMDRHRDIKQVNKEYLERKLAKTHPFNGPEKPPLYPNAHSLPKVASWIQTEIRKERLRKCRYNDY